jgi:maleate cis-trans isomerase
MGKRVILAVPENNTTLHAEVSAYCGEFDEVALARVPRPPHTMRPDDYPAYRQSTLNTVRPLIGDGADLVIFGCTGAGFMAGPDGNRAFADALAELVKAPAVSTASAMVAALAQSGAASIDLLSPYVDWKNERLVAFFAHYGIAVQNVESFEAHNPVELAKIGPAEVLDRALGVAGDAEALFIACTQLPTREIIPELRTRLDRPVWSAARATAWQALGTLGLNGARLA